MNEEPEWPVVWEGFLGDPEDSPREFVWVPLQKLTRPEIASILADAEQLAEDYRGRAALTYGFFRHFATVARRRLEKDTPNSFLIGVAPDSTDPEVIRQARGHIMAYAFARALDGELSPRVRAVWQSIFDDLERRQSGGS